MLCDSIKALILEEYTRQGAGFVAGVDIDAYLTKLNEQAEIVSECVSGRCRGFAAFYCNDTNTKQAYITLVLVDPRDRGLGLGKALVASVLEIARHRGFTSCRLEVAKRNEVAYAMYLSLGFRVAEIRDRDYLLEIGF
jgi:ribosomal protein S18 acetylase RimI-like enzyme